MLLDIYYHIFVISIKYRFVKYAYLYKLGSSRNMDTCIEEESIFDAGSDKHGDLL